MQLVPLFSRVQQVITSSDIVYRACA